MHTNRAWYKRCNPVVNRAARRNAERFVEFAKRLKKQEHDRLYRAAKKAAKVAQAA